MASTIVTKNSSTASAVPVTGDLTQGELAVNVTDKKLYTKDSGGTVVKLVGGLGNQEANAVAITGGSINGTTVGATTASTGAFTTLSASSTVSGTGFSTYLASPPAIGGTAAAAGSFTTLSASSTTTLSGGTANGVAYLNGSKVVTTGSALTFDGTTLGVGTSGSAWSTLKAVDLGSGGAVYGTAGQGGITANAYYNGSGFVYKATNGASVYQLVADSHRWSTAASGTGGTGITFTEGMRLTSTGLGIGTSSPGYKLDVNGTARFNNTFDFGAGQSITSGSGAYRAAKFGAASGAYNVLFSGSTAFQINDNADTANLLVLTNSGNLGLGVTPSAWNSTSKAFQVSTFVSVSQQASGAANFGFNFYEDAANTFKYSTTDEACRFSALTTGGFGWFTAASGTAGNAITFTQAMTLDASGNLLVGTTSSDGSRLRVYGSYQTLGDGSYEGLIGKASSLVSGGGAGEFAIRSSSNLLFATNGNTERARIDSSGNLLVGVTSGTRNWISKDNAGGYALTINNSNANPIGAQIYHNTDSNGTGNQFLDCQGAANVRAQIRSNGGIANYQANNVNLSDRREKTNFALAGEYLSKICAIPVQTFNYVDQNLEDDPGLTLGVVAQDVQAVAPELVSESNWGTEEEPKMRLSIYQTDLQYALMKALQELKAEFDAYKATHP